MNETDTKVDEALAAMDVVFTARYIGEPVKWEGHTVDHYRVKLGAFETDYYMGLGNREPIKGVNGPVTCPYPPHTTGVTAWNKQNVRPVAPTAASVLACLLSDASATDQCFADWAADFGYDVDSRKALATYEACCDIGRELRKVFTSAQRADLRGMLQDY